MELAKGYQFRLGRLPPTTSAEIYTMGANFLVYCIADQLLSYSIQVSPQFQVHGTPVPTTRTRGTNYPESLGSLGKSRGASTRASLQSGGKNAS